MLTKGSNSCGLAQRTVSVSFTLCSIAQGIGSASLCKGLSPLLVSFLFLYLFLFNDFCVVNIFPSLTVMLRSRSRCETRESHGEKQPGEETAVVRSV